MVRARMAIQGPLRATYKKKKKKKAIFALLTFCPFQFSTAAKCECLCV